jgi:outer membrane receptor protein involved in Fe transport
LKIQTARQRLLASTIIGGAAMLALQAAPAYAQDGQNATEVEGVVVTGSRIVRQDFEAISPVTTVGSEQLELTATMTVESLLNELPQIVPGNTRTSNNAGGEDFSTIDLRGLGPNRTLVLVNGERVPASSSTGVVDLNTIPASLIDRIEVVTGGASAVYGSDAISGVVNFILKDDYEGAEFNVTYGSSFEGLGQEIETNVLVGGNFANGRGNATAYASYYNREEVSQSEMGYTRNSAAACYDSVSHKVFACDTAAEAGRPNSIGVILAGGSGTPPWGWIANSAANPFNAAVLNAAFPTRFTGQDNDCNPATAPVDYGLATFGTLNLSFNDAGQLTPRFNDLNCGVPDRAAGSSRYNASPDNFLIIPGERFNMTTTVNYDVTDSVRAKVMLNFVNSSSEVQLAPTPATGLRVTLTPAMQALISTDHPDLWIALQSRPNPLAAFTMDRRTTEVGTRNGYSENNSFYALTTVDGDINDNWNWSATASFGSNHFDSNGTNSVNRTALAQGLAGCETAAGLPLGAAALPGCVPLDIFGPGTLDDAMVAFLRVNTFSETEIEESRVAGFIRGDLFDLPAGPVAMVFGVEYRDTDVVFRVDNEQRTGNIFGFNAVQNVAGAVQVTELYAELSVPLIKDQPFAHYLGIEGGYRTSDYSSVGQVNTFKVGAEWAPVDWLRFRGVYNEATRAPSALELFRGGDQGFSGFSEPCAFNAPGQNAAMQAFCVLQGVPAGLIPTFTANNTQVQQFAFGNPNLSPETAKTWTAGLVFQPDWFPVGDFRATIDYYDIAIDDAILGLGTTFFLNSCYTADLSQSDPAACARITRDPNTGQITAINTTVGNAATFATSGVDFQLEWTVNLEDTFLPIPGRLRVNELFSVIDSFEINGTDFIGTTSGSIGGALFDWKSVLSVYYTLGDWTLFARWSYVPEICDPTFAVGSTKKACDAPDFGQYDPAASYVDISARWNVTDNFQVVGFIGNVFDELPPQTPAGTVSPLPNTDIQLYDRVLGRTFSVSAKVRF